MVGEATAWVVPKGSPLLPLSLPPDMCMGVGQAWLLWKRIPASFPPTHPLATSTERLVHLTWGDDGLGPIS